MQNDKQWFSPEYGFFGEFYQRGDNSKKGYLSNVIQTQEQRTEEEVKGIIRLLNPQWLSPSYHPILPTPPSICDCPCGIGRHSIKLANEGYHVVAMDLNPDQLDVGKKKTQWIPLSQRPIFTEENMLNLDSYWFNKFDAVINMFFSFGFFYTDEENKKVTQNFFNLLKPGGKFLMHADVNMARIKNGKYKFKEKRQLVNGEYLEIMEHYNPLTKRIEGIWEIGDDKHSYEAKEYSVRVYENEEFVALCRSVGFKEVKIYSDWQGSPYSEDSEMVIFVAQK